MFDLMSNEICWLIYLGLSTLPLLFIIYLISRNCNNFVWQSLWPNWVVYTLFSLQFFTLFICVSPNICPHMILGSFGSTACAYCINCLFKKLVESSFWLLLLSSSSQNLHTNKLLQYPGVWYNLCFLLQRSWEISFGKQGVQLLLYEQWKI